MTNYSVGWLTIQVASILRGRAAQLGVKQARLGEVAGVSQSQMSKMLRGQRDITIDQLDWLCSDLGLELDAVIREAESQLPASREDEDPLSPWNRGVSASAALGGLDLPRVAAELIDRSDLPTLHDARESKRSRMSEPMPEAARDEDGE